MVVRQGDVDAAGRRPPRVAGRPHRGGAPPLARPRVGRTLLVVVDRRAAGRAVPHGAPRHRRPGRHRRGAGVVNVDIVMVTYNSVDQLPELFEALDGTGPVFVVDNASTDDSATVAEQLGATVGARRGQRRLRRRRQPGCPDGLGRPGRVPATPTPASPLPTSPRSPRRSTPTRAWSPPRRRCAGPTAPGNGWAGRSRPHAVPGPRRSASTASGRTGTSASWWVPASWCAVTPSRRSAASTSASGCTARRPTSAVASSTRVGPSGSSTTLSPCTWAARVATGPRAWCRSTSSGEASTSCASTRARPRWCRTGSPNWSGPGCVADSASAPAPTSTGGASGAPRACCATTPRPSTSTVPPPRRAARASWCARSSHGTRCGGGTSSWCASCSRSTPTAASCSWNRLRPCSTSAAAVRVVATSRASGPSGPTAASRASSPSSCCRAVSGPSPTGSCDRQVTRAVERLGFDDPALWVNDPSYASLAAATTWPSLYDITDDWTEADHARTGSRGRPRREAALRARATRWWCARRVSPPPGAPCATTSWSSPTRSTPTTSCDPARAPTTCRPVTWRSTSAPSTTTASTSTSSSASPRALPQLTVLLVGPDSLSETEPRPAAPATQRGAGRQPRPYDAGPRLPPARRRWSSCRTWSRRSPRASTRSSSTSRSLSAGPRSPPRSPASATAGDPVVVASGEAFVDAVRDALASGRQTAPPTCPRGPTAAAAFEQALTAARRGSTPPHPRRLRTTTAPGSPVASWPSPGCCRRSHVVPTCPGRARPARGAAFASAVRRRGARSSTPGSRTVDRGDAGWASA